MVQYEPVITNKDNWRYDVRQCIQSCPTCQKMDATYKAIRASSFVISSLKPIERIDTIGPIDEDFGLRYIIVIDTFTRYVEIFPNMTF